MITVRVADSRDLPRLTKLASNHMCEMALKGYDVLPTEKNLDIYMETYENWIIDGGTGVVVVSQDGDDLVGFCSAGGFPGGFETVYGKTAYTCGLFVNEDKRDGSLARAMDSLVRLKLNELGFKTLVGNVNLSDEPAMGGFSKRYIADTLTGHIEL